MTIPLNLDDELADSIDRVAKLTKLNRSEVMRQSIRFGLPIFADKWPKPYCNPELRNAKTAKLPSKDGAQ